MPFAVGQSTRVAPAVVPHRQSRKPRKGPRCRESPSCGCCYDPTAPSPRTSRQRWQSVDRCATKERAGQGARWAVAPIAVSSAAHRQSRSPLAWESVLCRGGHSAAPAGPGTLVLLESARSAGWTCRRSARPPGTRCRTLPPPVHERRPRRRRRSQACRCPASPGRVHPTTPRSDYLLSTRSGRWRRTRRVCKGTAHMRTEPRRAESPRRSPWRGSRVARERTREHCGSRQNF